MPNVIALRKTYSTLLDEAYKLASLTAVLDGPNDLAQEGANANEILIPKMSMSGLADYDKQTGYALGDVTLDFEEWVESNNMNDILPELDGHDATRVDVLQSGYLFSAEADLGRYQMICRVIYR